MRSTRRRPTRGARVDHRPARHLHQRQRHRGLRPAARPARAAPRPSRRCSSSCALVGIDKPVVAAVTGAAIGIGTTLLLHRDSVYVSDEARLAIPLSASAPVPEFASSLVVPRLLGNVKAAEKLLLVTRSRPRRRWRRASPTRCCRPARWSTTRGACRAFQRAATRRRARPSKLLRRAGTDDVLKTIAIEGRAVQCAPAQPEAMEAFRAFFQKRKPDFLEVLLRRGGPPCRSRSSCPCAAAGGAGAADAAPRAAPCPGRRRARGAWARASGSRC